MSKTVVLAVDVTNGRPDRNVAAAAEMVRELARDAAYRVIVLHVHEITYGRFGRLQVDCLEGEGDRLAADIAAQLAADGIEAKAAIRRAEYGYIAEKILVTADEYDARLIVVGSRSRTDLPHIPIGSVATRLLHRARRPVLVVPREPVTAEADEPATAMQDSIPAAG